MHIESKGIPTLINKSLILYGLVIFIAVASFITLGNYFTPASLTAYFLYLTGISTLCIIYGPILIFSKYTLPPISKPIVLIVCFCIYVIAHGAFIATEFNPFHTYLILTCLLILILYFMSPAYSAVLLLYKAIALITLFESAICLLQYAGLIKGLNSFFKVTGTVGNPNITAMFLGMATPAILVLLYEKKNIRNLAITTLSLVVLALIALQCRTAFIGFLVSCIIVVNYKTSFIKRLFRSKNNSGSILVVVLLVFFSIAAGNYLYNAKKASADGRILIWKVSTNMIADKPVFGYGYGLFEKNYNLAQAKYFKEGNGTPNEIMNADYVHMAYNEFLQNTVEGGIIGLVLFAGIIIALVYRPVTPPDQKHLQGQFKSTVQSKSVSNNIAADKYAFLASVAYAGVVSFTFISVFNFSIQAIPLMVLFAIYTAVLLTYRNGKNHNSSKQKRTIPIIKIVAGFGICVVGFFSTTTILKAASADITVHKAAAKIKSKKYEEAINLLAPLEQSLNGYEDYWLTYASALYNNNNYVEALGKLSKAKRYTSNPALYLNEGVCNQNLGYNNMADSAFMLAHYIEPGRLKPRFALMKLYSKENDTLEMVKTARGILQQRSKIKTKEALFYQVQAMQILKNLGQLSKKPTLNLFNVRSNETNN